MATNPNVKQESTVGTILGRGSLAVSVQAYGNMPWQKK